MLLNFTEIYRIIIYQKNISDVETSARKQTVLHDERSKLHYPLELKIRNLNEPPSPNVFRDFKVRCLSLKLML